ncbi:MAG: hypothetical protein IPF92_19650 [Myxococcales bacterium]|jgi:hypothetical protein|nr:hypothetical protein [Myxococcales bacterium]MBL0194365.1 hypothetical protein [Myxococcales bacterium]HQY61610.1 hypothetical protein [Polyangiaceae bacterium]
MNPHAEVEMGAAHNVSEESGVYRAVAAPRAGESLEHRRLAAGGRLPVDEVLRIADVLLFHVERAHAAGVRLGHVNTESVDLLDDGGLSVAGAGYSHADLPAPHSLRGGRVSDEVAREQDDVFVVGALLYVLLTGEEPRLGPHGPVGARALFSSPVPSKVSRAVARALHPRRSVRWRDVADLREALFATEGALPTLPESQRAPEWPIVLVRRVS